MAELYKALKIKKKIADEIDAFVNSVDDDVTVPEVLYHLEERYGEALTQHAPNELLYALYVAGFEQGIRCVINKYGNLAKGGRDALKKKKAKEKQAPPPPIGILERSRTGGTGTKIKRKKKKV